MGLMEAVASSKKVTPRRTVVYGVHGVGKSTWGTKWPDPVFIPTEDGISDLDVPAFPLATTLQEAWQPVIELGGGDHKFKTLVVDSADWLERLIWKSVCEKNNVNVITDIGYGQGYSQAAAKFASYLHSLNDCRRKGMHVVVIAHCQISKFASPEGDSYDRYTPKLHKDSSALLQEWADEVLFFSYRVFTKTQAEGFGKERAVGIGVGERVIKTTERPGHDAKNRLGLPDEMGFDFYEYAKFLPKGVVSKNGKS